MKRTPQFNNKMKTKISDLYSHDEKLIWKCHVTSLLQEMVLCNEKMGIFKQPVNILGRMFEELAVRCSEINDPILNDLMLRFAFYEAGDAFNKKAYDNTLCLKIRREAIALRKKLNKK